MLHTQRSTGPSGQYFIALRAKAGKYWGISAPEITTGLI